MQADNIEKITAIIEQDLAQNDLLPQERFEVAKTIEPFLQKGSIVLAQTNPTPGDLKGNAQKAMRYINWATLIGADAVVFPEMFLIGYPIGDFIDKFPVIVEENMQWLEALATKTSSTKVIIGFAQKNPDKTGKKYYNAVAVLAKGKVEKIIRKSLLPNYSEFNDYRHFEPAPVDSDSRIIDINGIKTGIIVCEDGWNDEEFFESNLYSNDPVKELVDKHHPDLLINCSSSITRAKKEQLKHNMLSFVSKKYHCPLIYVNQTGSNDGITFDGASRMYNAQGELKVRAKYFEEQFLIVNPCCNEENISPLPKGLEKTLTSQKAFSLDHEPDLERTYLTITGAIRDYFHKTGFKRAVLGLSGGLDSTVCAVLLADAIGAENVFGLSMPSKLTSDLSKSDAQELAQNLKINFLEISIKDMIDLTKNHFEKVFEKVQTKWDCRYKESFTMDNIQARSRALILWGIANEFQACLPIATSDKSELYMGYATINGDMSGGFAPIADVCKTKLFALAKWMNENREEKNAVPISIINKRPCAELAINPLTNKILLAEEALMPYEFLDEVIWRVENLNQSIDEMMEAIFLHEAKENITKEQKAQWLEKFFSRMSKAFFKWGLMPPYPIIDARSINKYEYCQPVVSSRILYKSSSLEEKILELRS